jgi:hypothetical protein
MKIIAAALFLIFLGGCEGQNWQLDGAKVVSVSARPAPSGVFSTFVELDVVSNDDEPITLFVQYLGGDQYIPDEGAECSARGHFARINGYSAISDPINRFMLHRYVDNLECVDR